MTGVVARNWMEAAVCDDMTNVLQKGMQPPSDVVDKQEVHLPS